MFPIEWDPKFEVGNFEIDFEHQIFVKIIHKLKDAHYKGDEKFLELLSLELLKYAEFHFCSEENIMFKNQYPDLIHHKQEHETLLAELRNRIFSLKYEYIDFDKLEIFLFEWFKKHTAVEDQKLASFLNNK